MLDAGVPVTSLVAGVAMGLILGESENEEPVILTDILGLEDALGTMDFKVAIYGLYSHKSILIGIY